VNFRNWSSFPRSCTSVVNAAAAYRFLREVIAVAVRWYLRYGLSYRDVEELAERGINVDHVTVYRWVQTFTAEFIDAARAARHAIGSRWFPDQTYVRIAGRWEYLYWAIDQHRQVIDVLVSPRRNAAAAPVLHDRTAVWGTAERDHHRQGTGLPTRRRRARARGAAHNRPLCGAATARCGDSNAPGRYRPSQLDTHWCRTCAAATTSSFLTTDRATAYASRSTYWPRPCNQAPTRDVTTTCAAD
jgi:hypothetical protein